MATRADRQAKGGTLILGGGFAGATVAERLGKQGATIVNPDNFLLYTPMLPEAASGIIDTRHVVVPLRAMCPESELLLGWASGLDEENRVVEVTTEDEGTMTIGYENLVIALGAIIRIFPIPGLAENTLPFKNLPDGIALRNHVIRKLEDACECEGPEQQKQLTFVFIGGGYSGVESCAEMKDLVDDAMRHYPALKGVQQRWMLVDAGPEILGTLPPKLQAYAHKHMTDDGIEIRTDTRLQEVEEDAVILSDGERIEAATIVWAAGVQPHPLVRELGLPIDEKSSAIVVDDHLRVQGRTNVYSLGDCAHVPNPKNPRGFDPPTCQHAIRQAKRLAKNLKGADEPYAFKTLGQVAQLGRYKGVSETLGVRRRGFMGFFIARGYHLYAFPLMSRRIRIMLDWLVGMFFKRDIVQTGPAPRKGHHQPENRHKAMAVGTHDMDAAQPNDAQPQDGVPAVAEPEPAAAPAAPNPA
jgi:NADH dehydrogenase